MGALPRWHRPKGGRHPRCSRSALARRQRAEVGQRGEDRIGRKHQRSATRGFSSRAGHPRHGPSVLSDPRAETKERGLLKKKGPLELACAHIAYVCRAVRGLTYAYSLAKTYELSVASTFGQCAASIRPRPRHRASDHEVFGFLCSGAAGTALSGRRAC